MLARGAAAPIAWALCLFAGAAPARAAAADAPTFNPRTGLYELPLRALVAAHQRGDRAELARVAGRLGPSRLGETLAGNDGVAARAVLDAVADLPEAPVFTGELAALLLREGREGASPLAARAAEVLGRLLGAPRALADWDVPPDVTASGCAALAQVAASAASGADVRLGAIEAFAEGAATCGSRAELTALLLADVSPDLRRAALLVLPASGSTGRVPGAAGPRASLAAAPRALPAYPLLADPVPKVARAAAVAACRRARGAGGRLFLAPPVRALLLADDADAEDVVEILPCLPHSGNPDDRRLLETISRRRVSPVAERARELLPNP